MWTEWTTAQIALVISGLSFVLAFTSLIWNVWSKFIFPKPKIDVWVDLRYIHRENLHSASILSDGTFAADFDPNMMSEPHLTLIATNYGPGKSTISLPCMKLHWLHPRKRDGHAIITAYDSFPREKSASSLYSHGLPKVLDQGEEFRLAFPIESYWYEKRVMKTLGIRDNFSRFHWASRRNIKRLRRQYIAHLERSSRNTS